MSLKYVLALLLSLPACSPGSDAAAGCPDSDKVCGGRCVSRDDPATGCGSESCEPCALSHASARCEAGRCVVSACAVGSGDCDSDPTNGCETTLASDPAHCGTCGNACATGQLCRDARCLDENVTRLVGWLASQKGGYCNTEFNQIVTLCNNTKWTGTDAEFCFDESLLGPYPDGIEISLGFHWAGDAHGNLFDIGGDAVGPRVSAAFSAGGRLGLIGPNGAGNLEIGLTEGTHLLTYRVNPRTSDVFLDGVLMVSGPGTGGVLPDLTTPSNKSPGAVLGQRQSYWWEATPSSPQRWARFAPFFFHLRDAPKDGDGFSFEGVTQPGPGTRLLLDASGVEGTTWNARDGVHKAYARNGAQWVTDGLACLKAGR